MKRFGKHLQLVGFALLALTLIIDLNYWQESYSKGSGHGSQLVVSTVTLAMGIAALWYYHRNFPEPTKKA
jgi:hypothetical protein